MCTSVSKPSYSLESIIFADESKFWNENFFCRDSPFLYNCDDSKKMSVRYFEIIEKHKKIYYRIL